MLTKVLVNQASACVRYALGWRHGAEVEGACQEWLHRCTMLVDALVLPAHVGAATHGVEFEGSLRLGALMVCVRV